MNAIVTACLKMLDSCVPMWRARLGYEDALEYTKVTADYNAYNPQRVASMLRKVDALIPRAPQLPHDVEGRQFRVWVGMEYSPVLYLDLPDMQYDERDIIELEILGLTAYADECGEVVSPECTGRLLYRYWWD